jgi:hypothetical protein
MAMNRQVAQLVSGRAVSPPATEERNHPHMNIFLPVTGVPRRLGILMVALIGALIAASATIQTSVMAAGPTVVFEENFDAVTVPALPTDWTTSGSSPWGSTTASADTPPNSAFATNFPSPSDNQLTSPFIHLFPGDATLTFRHRFSFETDPICGVGCDGGMLEISVNGDPFQDIVAAGGSFESGGYTGTIGITVFVNPLSGRSAWVGASGGSSPAR